MIVATASSMDQIRPRDTDFAKLRPAAGLQLRLARGEYESLQIAATAAEGLTGVRVEAAGFPFEVKPRIVGYTNAKDPARYPQAYCEKSDALTRADNSQRKRKSHEEVAVDCGSGRVASLDIFTRCSPIWYNSHILN